MCNSESAAAPSNYSQSGCTCWQMDGHGKCDWRSFAHLITTTTILRAFVRDYLGDPVAGTRRNIHSLTYSDHHQTFIY